jgi:hypothetical protein
MVSIEDRDRGVLSPADRDYLRNPGDYNPQAAYERNKYIKQRLTDALIDFAVFANADDDMRADLLEGANEELENAKQQLMENAIQNQGLDGVGEVLGARGGPPARAVPETISVLYELVEDIRGESFEDAVAAGVTEAARRQRPGREEFVLTGSGVTINPPETINIERVREKVENKQYFDLSRAELLYVVYSDEYDHDLDAVGSAQAALDPEDKQDAGEAGFYGDVSRGAVLGVRTQNLRGETEDTERTTVDEETGDLSPPEMTAHEAYKKIDSGDMSRSEFIDWVERTDDAPEVAEHKKRIYENQQEHLDEELRKKSEDTDDE